MAELTIHGARGSVPASGEATARYGGHTTCMSARLSDGSYLVVNAGTGLAHLQAGLSSTNGLDVHMLITHYHLDHIMGLPFFEPLYDPDSSFTFYGFPYGPRSVKDAITAPFHPPWFPVELSETPSTKTYVDLDGSDFTIGDVRVSTGRLRHPQDVTAYRLDGPSSSIVIATDYEADEDHHDVVELARGADVLIHDAQYTPEDYGAHEGWGHSTWVEAVIAAEASGVKRLVLTSHAPDRTDVEVDDYTEMARLRFAETEAAAEGTSIPL